MKEYVMEKRNELIWALSLQDYSLTDMGEMFGLDKATVHRVIGRKPRGWKPKWVKKP